MDLWCIDPSGKQNFNERPLVKFNKPNVRKWFIPDPGFTMFDADLQQADAHVVAWEADDEELKEIFRDPSRDLHRENCLTLFSKYTKHGRQLAKAGVHATNYGASARTLARALGITVQMAEAFQRRWFGAHPNIRKWQRRIESQLQSTRTIRNAFGFKIRYNGRIGGILPEALAWIPQSTVAIAINHGLNNLEKHPDIQTLIQVHDSIVGQFKHTFYPRRKEIRDAMTILVPYDDPLYIGVDITCSRKSWGDCKAPNGKSSIPWEDAAVFCPY